MLRWLADYLARRNGMELHYPPRPDPPLEPIVQRCPRGRPPMEPSTYRRRGEL